MSALIAAEAAMLHDVERMRVLSHNLANATTPGFRRDLLLARPFEAQLGAALRAGVSQVSGVAEVDRSPAALRHTGAALDVALEGDGYFALDTRQGARFSREGSFRLDTLGRLVTPAGDVVMGSAGDIVLSGAEPRIDQAGNVWERETLVATLRVVRFAPDAQPRPLGGGLYAADAAPAELEQPRVRQGYLEASNVVPMREMVRLIETVRHFEASQRVVRGYDEMMERALGLLGES